VALGEGRGLPATPERATFSDPKSVLAERVIVVPDNIDVNVVENSENTVQITMHKPPSEAGDLSDEEMQAASHRRTWPTRATFPVAPPSPSEPLHSSNDRYPTEQIQGRSRFRGRESHQLPIAGRVPGDPR